MEIRRLDDRRINVGEWDWETFEAHKRGQQSLSQTEVMAILKRPQQLESVQQAAVADAAIHARRLCVVVDNFLSEAECDTIIGVTIPLLKATQSPSLCNLVLNYSHDSGDANESTVRLLTDVSERLYARLSQLGLDGEAGRDLLRELAVAPEWSSRDYHVRHKSEHGGAGGEMEVRLSAMSDYVRAMLYSAPLEPDGGAPSPATGDHGEEARDEGDFATDPRNAHHDGRN